MDKKKLIKTIIYVKLLFTTYLLVSLMIVPDIGNVNAEVIGGAHRGASLDCEENTLEAFGKALEEEKYQFIEFDVEYTKDKKIAVIHQNTKYRTPKKFSKVENLTYEELNDKFEFDIPQYHEVMDLIGGEKPLDIEIKTSGNSIQDIELAEFVINDCKERGIINRVMISSPSKDVVEYVEENYPEIKTGKVYWITPASIIPMDNICEEIYDTPADYVLLHGYNLYNYETLVECKPEDKELIFWYFTDEVYIIGKDNKFWEDC